MLSFFAAVGLIAFGVGIGLASVGTAKNDLWDKIFGIVYMAAGASVFTSSLFGFLETLHAAG